MPAAGAFRALRPERVFDTRFDGQLGPAAKVPGGQSIRVQVTGMSDVPVGAAAVSMNLTVTEADTEGVRDGLSLWRFAAGVEAQSSPGERGPQRCGRSRCRGRALSVCDQHRPLLGDLNGWFAGGGGLASVVERKLDTCEMCGSGAALARETGNVGGNEFLLGWGACADALAFIGHRASRAGVDIMGFTLEFLELTADGAPGPSCWRHVVTVLPLGGGAFAGQLARRSTCDPASSVELGEVYVSLDAMSGDLTVLFPLPVVRTVGEIVWRATVIDVNGRPVEAPAGLGGQEAWFRGAVPPFPPSNEKYFVPVETMYGTAAIVNLTATGSSRGGFAVAEPSDSPAVTSAVNYQAGQTRANLAIVPISFSAEGKKGFCVRGTDTHLVVDVLGVLGPPGT